MKAWVKTALVFVTFSFLVSCDPSKSENKPELDFGNDTVQVSIGQEGFIEGLYSSLGPTPISFSTTGLPANLIGKFSVYRQNSNIRILGPSPFPVNGSSTTESHQYADILVEIISNENTEEGVYPLEITARSLEAELYEEAQTRKTIYIEVLDNDASCIPPMLGGYTVNDNCSAGNPYSGTVVQTPTEGEIWFNFPGWGSALVVGQVSCTSNEIIIDVQTVTTSSGQMNIEGVATFSDSTGDMIIDINYTMVPTGSTANPINCSSTWEKG